jgi:hypothetical protein
VVFLTSLFVPALYAAPVPLGSDLPDARLGVSAGWDSAPWVGAEGGVALGRRVQLDLAVGGPVGGLPGAFDAMAGVSSVARWRGPWGLFAGAGTGLTHAADASGEQLAWTAEVTLRPGAYAATRQLSLDLGWRGSLATHIHHSDAVAALYDDRYPDGGGSGEGPIDGWYALPAGELHLGLTGGIRGRHLGAALRAGLAWTPQRGGGLMNGMLGVIPMYGTSEVTWLW